MFITVSIKINDNINFFWGGGGGGGGMLLYATLLIVYVLLIVLTCIHHPLHADTPSPAPSRDSGFVSRYVCTKHAVLLSSATHFFVKKLFV